MKTANISKKPKKKHGFFKTFWRYRYLYLLMLPGLVYFVLFKYVPMYGILIAFKNYRGSAGGFAAIWDSPWVGLQNFKMFFNSIYFKRIFGNTMIISIMRIIFTFPAPILLALMINEISNRFFKRAVQTITYMPYFLSWVVVAGIMTILFSPDGGPINAIRQMFGLEPIYFLTQKSMFRGFLMGSEIWKNIGYGSIVYLAAIAGVDQTLYDAARVDGATRLQQIRYITLPAISGIIAIMLILTVGRILDDNFAQIYNLYNTAVYEVADVFETYIYRTGITEGKFSYTAAVGLFKSAISLVFVFTSNFIAKKMGSEGIF